MLLCPCMPASLPAADVALFVLRAVHGVDVLTGASKEPSKDLGNSASSVSAAPDCWAAAAGYTAG